MTASRRATCSPPSLRVVAAVVAAWACANPLGAQGRGVTLTPAVGWAAPTSLYDGPMNSGFQSADPFNRLRLALTCVPGRVQRTLAESGRSAE